MLHFLLTGIAIGILRFLGVLTIPLGEEDNEEERGSFLLLGSGDLVFLGDLVLLGDNCTEGKFNFGTVCKESVFLGLPSSRLLERGDITTYFSLLCPEDDVNDEVCIGILGT